MLKKATLCCLPLIVALGALPAWGQKNDNEALTARDMFRKATGRLVPAAARPARPEPPKTANRPSRPATQPAETTAHATPPTESATTPPPTLPPANTNPPGHSPATSQPTTQVATGTPPGRSPEVTNLPSRATNDHGPEVVLVSSRPPLGLRYSILKQTSGGGTVEVDAETVFRSGDRIRLTVATTETAYVYVVTRGSSGKWQVLFPSADIGQGSNLIPGGVIYPIPAGHWFAFDEQVGTENLFVMVSRQPERDLDSLIYKLKESGDDKEPFADEPPVLVASNIPPVDDSVISRLRGEVYARDLVFEKVDDAPPAAAGETVRPEKAVYVVNKTGADDSRVVADIKLQHQ